MAVREIAASVGVTVLLAVTNHVCYKLALVPMKGYPFFLVQASAFGYIAGIVTKEMLSLPKVHFVVIGVLEALGVASGMSAGGYSIQEKTINEGKADEAETQSRNQALEEKVKSSSNNPSQIIQHHLKKQQTHKEETSSNWDANKVTGSGIIIRDRDATPRASVIDFNQACVPIGDEMNDFDATREPVRPDKMKSYYLEGEQAMSSDVRTSVCRDGKGKRKITWQDQVALRV